MYTIQEKVEIIKWFYGGNKLIILLILLLLLLIFKDLLNFILDKLHCCNQLLLHCCNQLLLHCCNQLFLHCCNQLLLHCCHHLFFGEMLLLFSTIFTVPEIEKLKTIAYSDAAFFSLSK